MTPVLERVFRDYPLGSQDEEDEDALVIVRYDSRNESTWLITEGEELPSGDWLFYGFYTRGLSNPINRRTYHWGWGTVKLSDLQTKIEDVERDLFLFPLESTVRKEVYYCDSFS